MVPSPMLAALASQVRVNTGLKSARLMEGLAFAISLTSARRYLQAVGSVITLLSVKLLFITSYRSLYISAMYFLSGPLRDWRSLLYLAVMPSRSAFSCTGSFTSGLKSIVWPLAGRKLTARQSNRIVVLKVIMV